MKKILFIAQREFLSLLAAPTAWIFLIIYLVLCGLVSFVFSDIISMGQAELSPFFGWMPWIFMVVIPALGMPLWSEERKSGTFELALSYPANIVQFVLGKYLAGLAVLLIALFLTAGIPVTIILLGEPDMGAVFCGYAGAFLIGAVFLSVSCFCSAVSKSQTASYLLSLFICAALVFSGWDRVSEMMSLYLAPFICRLLSYCAVIPHYQAFQRGILDSSEVLYALAMTALFLFCTRSVLLFSASGSGSIFNRGTLSDRYTLKKIGKVLVSILLAIYSFFCITYFTGTFHFMLDCTEDKAYSLSALSKAIAADLEKPVVIRFYTSPAGGNMPKEYQLYSSRIEWLLKEFADASNGKVELQIIQPESDSLDEEAAFAEGVRQVQNPNGDRFFLGISVSCYAKTAAIPFLSPRQENLLEYELVRAVLNATGGEKKIVGVLSAFPVLGQKANPTENQKAAARWTFLEEASKDYYFLELPFDIAEIPSELSALLIFHPAGISSKTLYAVDQYLLRGGNIGIFLDPDSAYARANLARDYSMLNKQTSDLGPLPEAWGIQYDPNVLAADMIFKLDRIARNGTRQVIPTVLNIGPQGINRNLPFLQALSAMRMNFTGAFPLKEQKPDLVYEQLLHTTEQAELVSVNDMPEKIFAEYQSKKAGDPTVKEYPLAWRISGLFPSAYPSGSPDAAGHYTYPHLAKAEKSGQVFLLGDTDMLFHDAIVQPFTDEFNQVEVIRINDNLTFFQNIMEELTHSPQLAVLRSRIPMNRPLTKVNESKLKADLKYKDQILALGSDFSRMQKQVEILNKYLVAMGGE